MGGGIQHIARPYWEDPYYEAFYNNKSYNEACYHCKFAEKRRTGDLTIGDYSWAVDIHPKLREFNKNRSNAVSCVLVNTDQGEQLLQSVKANYFMEKTDYDWISQRNPNLIRPTPRPKEREHIYKDIESMGYGKWAKKYYRSGAYLIHKPVISIYFRAIRKIKKMRSR